MNAGSSRSHSVAIIEISQRDTVTQTVKGGKLCLVDLAGSETVIQPMWHISPDFYCTQVAFDVQPPLLLPVSLYA